MRWPKVVTVEEAKLCIDRRQGFIEKEEGGCWYWLNTVKSGYGPHMAFWEAATGKHVREGYTLFHDCLRGHDGCVNPDHMREIPEDEWKKANHLAPTRDVEGWARALRAERLARGWSQSRMAKELGVHNQTIKSWELGERRPTRTLQRIAAGVLGWEAEPRKFVVTVVLQDVIAAHSSGEAIKAMFDTLPPPERGVRKRDLVSCRIVK